MAAESEAAVQEIIRTQLIDNPMDSIARQMRHIYAKLAKKEAALEGSVDRDAQLDALRLHYATKLRELLAKGCDELEFQSKQLCGCINIIEIDQRKGLFEAGSKANSPTTRRPKEDNVDIPITDITVGSQVAARVARSHELWILASVIKVDQMKRVYEVEDEDSGDEDTEGRRHHMVPRDWIIPLPREDQVNEWISFKWNQKVMAMYPNTTSFYPAIVVIPNPPGSLYVVVKFEDDADELGYSPERKVPFRFVTPIKKT